MSENWDACGSWCSSVGASVLCSLFLLASCHWDSGTELIWDSSWDLVVDLGLLGSRFVLRGEGEGEKPMNVGSSSL